MSSIRQITSMEKRISTSTLVETALWLVFFGSFIEPYLMTSGERFINYLFVQCGGMFLIFLSLRYFKYLKSYIRLNRAYWLLFPMLAICLWGTVYGRLLGPSSFQAWIFNSLLVYAGASLILLPTQENIHRRLLIVFRRQFLCAIVFGLYALFTAPSFQDIMQDKELWMGSYEKPALTILLSLVPFFLGFVVKERNKKTILAALSGYMVCIALGLRGTSRATLIVNFLVIPLSVLAVNSKYRGMRQISFLFKSAIFVSLILGSVFLIRPDFVSKLDLSDAWGKTIWRFSGHREWVGAAEMKLGLMSRINRQVVDVRGAEARDFLDSSTWFKYVAGNGFGVKWYSTFWGREWDVVHFGPVHLIYRGGIPLLVTYFLLLLFALRASWRNCGSDSVAMGCFVYLMVWTVNFFSYGAHQSSYYNYIFWLVIGLAFATDIKKKQDAPFAERAKSGFIRRAATGIK